MESDEESKDEESEEVAPAPPHHPSQQSMRAGASLLNHGVPVLVPVRASPVPSVVRGSFVVKFLTTWMRCWELKILF